MDLVGIMGSISQVTGFHAAKEPKIQVLPVIGNRERRLMEMAIEEHRREVMGAFLYTHNRANSNRLLEAAPFLYVLIELLPEKGLRPSRN